MARVIMNGREYSGRSVTILKNKVFVDGVETTPDAKEITIKVEGNLDNLSVDCCKDLKVNSNIISNIVTTSGDVVINKGEVGNITTTSGDVKCKDIIGDVRTVSGDIECNAILGNVFGANVKSKN